MLSSRTTAILSESLQHILLSTYWRISTRTQSLRISWLRRMRTATISVRSTIRTETGALTLLVHWLTTILSVSSAWRQLTRILQRLPSRQSLTQHLISSLQSIQSSSISARQPTAPTFGQRFTIRLTRLFLSLTFFTAWRIIRTVSEKSLRINSWTLSLTLISIQSFHLSVAVLQHLSLQQLLISRLRRLSQTFLQELLTACSSFLIMKRQEQPIMQLRSVSLFLTAIPSLIRLLLL